MLYISKETGGDSERKELTVLKAKLDLMVGCLGKGLLLFVCFPKIKKQQERHNEVVVLSPPYCVCSLHRSLLLLLLSAHTGAQLYAAVHDPLLHTARSSRE